ncbi:phage tail tape measure protein [Providencia stuartii]|uniref:Phage tail tape measure protein, TP901 family n=1 Tax=Providencia stuartii ATCC 25827 TaxID=471874 RepID=A0AA86YJC5_PROST|nr:MULTISPECIES: phage tail tape measure protein [Providencia]EDU59362.1 phage tail tape measure protein, TP901 family [Providencia stuartii ATCC 25827]MBS7784858.1 phage tail tape measure protein [Providencia thailandensis]MTC82211.1 phage tail tape measure protein [Providencia stuartii]MTC93257.1 phage tail tape measure protein [Providencia stuartii]
MSDRNLNIRVSLSAANLLSGPLGAAQRSAAGLSAKIRTTQSSIRNLQGQAKTFERLSQSIEKNTRAYDDAKNKVKALRDAYPPLNQQTEAQKKALAAARLERDRLGRTLDKEKQRLATVRAELYRQGISARNSADVTAQATRRTEAYNRQLDEQRRRLAATTRAQTQYTKAKEVRNKLAMGGAMAVAGGTGALYAGARITAPGRDFDEGMSTVQALTRLDKNSPQLAMLRQQARELGASTAYTSTDVAAGQKFLAMAGFTPDAIKAALGGVLNMGLAGDMDLGEASDIGSNVLTQFQLKAEDMNRVSDVLTATFTRSNTDLRQLGETMTYAGPIAAQLGVSLESMAAMAGTMADNGIRGSMAGTSLRAGLSRMVAPVGKGQAALDKLGVSVKDASGKLRDADEILKDVGKSMRKFDQASQIRMKKDIFGEEAMVGMGAVIDAVMNGRYDALKTANMGAEGEADKNAKVKIDNLKGDLKQLESAWEDLGIEIQENVDSPLRRVTQSLTGFIGKVGQWMKEHPKTTQALAVGAIAIATLVTALGALALAAATVIVPFAAMRLSLFMLTGSQGFGGLMVAGSNAINLIGGGFSLLLSPVGLFVAAIVAAGVLIYQYWEPIKAFFSGFWDGFTAALAPIGVAFSATFAPFAPIFDGISNAVSKVWNWFKELLSPVQLSTEELKSCTEAGQVFGEVVGNAISALFFPIQQVAKGLGWILEKLGVIPSAAEAAADAARAMGVDPNEKDPFKVLNSVSAYAGKIAKANEQAQKQQAEATSKITSSVTVAGKQLEKSSELQKKANDVNPLENAEKYGTLVYDGAEKKSKQKGSKSALSDAAESVDRNKLGDIVFKNFPAVTTVDGLYQEPRIAARKTSLFPQFNDVLINTLAPIQPKLNAVPVAVSPTRPERQIMQPEYNTFELNFYGVDMSNKKEIADIVKQQLTTLLRERDSRRRSSLKDQD